MKHQHKLTSFLYFICLLVMTSAVAQTKDPAAKSLLNAVNTTIESYKNITVNFRYILENESENIKQETTGNITLEDDKYVLDILGIQRIFDGKTLYTISTEDEEVTISADNDDEESTISPSSLFNFYEEGYNYKMDIIQNKFGRSIQYIKFSPIDYDSEIKYALLGIDLTTNHIYNLIEIGKNDTKTTLTVDRFEPNRQLSPNFFKYDASQYEGYYINNLD